MTYNQDTYKPVIPSTSYDADYDNDNVRQSNANNY